MNFSESQVREFAWVYDLILLLTMRSIFSEVKLVTDSETQAYVCLVLPGYLGLPYYKCLEPSCPYVCVEVPVLDRCQIQYYMLSDLI